MAPRSTLDSAERSVSDQCSRLGTKPLDARERKRDQNRAAQRTYRRNQKERLRFLEEAAGQRAVKPKQHLPLTPAISETDQFWLSSPKDDIFNLPPLDVSSFSQPELIEDKQPSPLSSNEEVEDSFSTDTLTTSPPTNVFRTALHRAICARQESITQFLLQQGADTRKRDGNGQTALHLAVQNGHESLVQILLENKVDPNVQDALGQTALFRAVQCNNEAIAKMLLEAAIDVNCRDTFGAVALHVAVERGSQLLVETLLSYGADIDA